MVIDLSARSEQDEMERNAYNAAFYELGFRWYWGSDTYSELLCHGSSTTERIRYYLETYQSHLLKAYDADFLVRIIHEKQARHRRDTADSNAATSGYFDWTQTLGAELGA